MPRSCGPGEGLHMELLLSRERRRRVRNGSLPRSYRPGGQTHLLCDQCGMCGPSGWHGLPATQQPTIRRGAPAARFV